MTAPERVQPEGIFITFEGIDGCGKSTQARLAADFFTSRGYSVHFSYEPGGSSIGPAIRSLLLDSSTPPSPLAEAFLFSAERAQHVTERVRPALARGEVVILDRHTDSTLAYQGYGSGQDLAILRQLNLLATGGLVPTATFLLDLEPSLAATRMGKRPPDRFEREADEFHQRVRKGFLQLAAQEPERIRVIDASLSQKAVTLLIQKQLEILAGKAHA